MVNFSRDVFDLSRDKAISHDFSYVFDRKRIVDQRAAVMFDVSCPSEMCLKFEIN